MKKSHLLRVLQQEIRRHNLSTFMNEHDKLVDWLQCVQKAISHQCSIHRAPLRRRSAATAGSTVFRKIELYVVSPKLARNGMRFSDALYVSW
jgi:hypothetical protein